MRLSLTTFVSYSLSAFMIGKSYSFYNFCRAFRTDGYDFVSFFCFNTILTEMPEQQTTSINKDFSTAFFNVSLLRVRYMAYISISTYYDTYHLLYT